MANNIVKASGDLQSKTMWCHFFNSNSVCDFQAVVCNLQSNSILIQHMCRLGVGLTNWWSCCIHVHAWTQDIDVLGCLWCCMLHAAWMRFQIKFGLVCSLFWGCKSLGFWIDSILFRYISCVCWRFLSCVDDFVFCWFWFDGLVFHFCGVLFSSWTGV